MHEYPSNARTSIRSIYVVGGGSVGAFLAARLGCSGSQTTLVVRDGTADRFENGIALFENDAVTRIQVPCVEWGTLKSFPEGSVVLVATKALHLDEVLPLLKARLPSDAEVVFCQNGLGVIEGEDPRWGRMVCWFGTRAQWIPDRHALQIQVAGVQGVELAGCTEVGREFLARALRQARIPMTLRSSVKEVEWRKALWNVANNGLCALADAPNGQGANDPWLRPLVERLLSEALEVAQGEGVVLEEGYSEVVLQAMRNTASNLNSTLQDLRAGRKTEMPWINGAVIKRAEKLGISVPANQFVNNLVHFFEENHKRTIFLSES